MLKKAHVYTDKAMTKEISVIPLGMSGKSGLWNSAEFYCKPGTNYLKELDTPRGYILHKDPFGPAHSGRREGSKIKAPPIHSSTPMPASSKRMRKQHRPSKGQSTAFMGIWKMPATKRTLGVFEDRKDGRSNLLKCWQAKYIMSGKSALRKDIKKTLAFTN